MKTFQGRVARNPILILLPLLLYASVLPAQLQWYQNQDGSNMPPNGTYAASIQRYNSSSFIACYQWQVVNDIYTWKISRSDINGTELATFYTEGTYATAETKVVMQDAIYVLKKDYPPGMDPQYTIYRLNANLEVLSERVFAYPNGFIITNLSGFEIDKEGNVYLAGDGQYPDTNGGYGYASFVEKMNRSLVTKWNKMDSVQTSYTKLLVDDNQKVVVIEDNYNNYPAIRVIRFNAAGVASAGTPLVPDAGRFSLYAAFDNNQDLLLYGGKMINDSTQAIYMCKLSRMNGQVLFRKTQFMAPGSQLNDLKMDEQGRIFSLVTLYYPDRQFTQLSRLKPNNGDVIWTRTFPFETDSCQLNKIVINASEQFYAIGEKRCGSYFARGFAIKMKKNGQLEANLPGPDSVAFQRYHSLVDGFIDGSQQLVAIGNTNDYDTTIYNSTYYRAFAARFIENYTTSKAVNSTEELVKCDVKVQFYPNPVQDQMLVTNLDPATFDQLQVYDLQGKVLLQRKINNSVAQINVSGMAEGVYLLALRSTNTQKQTSVKFIVRH